MWPPRIVVSACWLIRVTGALIQIKEALKPDGVFIGAMLGGDTLFTSQVEAYKRLSPEFQKRLEGLRAVHSAVEQAEHSRNRGGPVRREPVESEVCTCSYFALAKRR